MKGKLTELEVRSYDNNKEALYLFKDVHFTRESMVRIIIDINRNSNHFENFPYIFKHFKYDLYGEFGIEDTKSGVKDGQKQERLYFNITKIDKIEINS